MDFTSPQNVSETWRRWKRGMEYYLAATCKMKSEAEKVAIFMYMIGRDGQEIKDTFEFETEEDGTEKVTTMILFTGLRRIASRERIWWSIDIASD